MARTSSITLMGLAGQLLRAPEQLLAVDGHDERSGSASADRLAHLAPKLLALTVVGAGLFGVALGSYRGGIQLLFAALKTPLLLLIPVLIGLPAVRAFHGACEISVSWPRVALSGLTAVARTAILAAATGPVLWLYYSLTPDYHQAILAMAAALVVVGGVGLSTLIRCLPSGGRNRALASLTSLAVLGILLAQSGWLLRPFVARPRAELSFLRPIESNIYSSMASVRRSATGDYRGWEARGGGLLGREAPQ